ncbi:MAG: hypothetical protein JNN12_15555 [Bacteroidetes Order II. Incertae sedis bacterium]|nr:hypothetical protein [Bacteroidetes Order II. bacterium]
MAASTGYRHHTIKAIDTHHTYLVPLDTVKTLIVEGKIKTIKTIGHHLQNVKPVRMTFTDETYLYLSKEEALNQGITLPPISSDPTTGSGVPPKPRTSQNFCRYTTRVSRRIKWVERLPSKTHHVSP